jgi:integrase
LLQGKFRSRFNKARKAAKKQIDALASKVGSEKLHELGLEWFPFQFRDLRPKAATGKERATGTAETRRFLGHTTERQTADYVRDKIGELVNRVAASQPEWMAKVLSPKSTNVSEKDSAKPLKDLEAGVGIEPASTALQAAA